MFNIEFYPTDEHTISLMDINCRGKVVLEPSAGKGNIVDWLNSNGATQVLTCERSKELAMIVSDKSRFIGHDFFDVTPEEISHIDMIVMNPPFSNAARHIIHAHNIAPSGCTIISLMNTSNFESSRNDQYKTELFHLPYHRIDLGKCFKGSERTTNVDVSCITLRKTECEGGIDFDLFTDEPDNEIEGNGMIGYNEIRAIVSTYVSSCKKYMSFRKQAEELNNINKRIGASSIELVVRDSSKGSQYNTLITEPDYRARVQRKAWDMVFTKMNMEKYLTASVMADVNKFIEQQKDIPFTMKNVYRMIEVIVATRDQNFKRALCEAVDNFTKHHHDNRHGVEGWKTNDAHLLGKRFIVSSIISTSYQGAPDVSYQWNRNNKVDELTKVLCWLTANDYSKIGTIMSHFRNAYSDSTPNYEKWGKWSVWGFFEVRPYKKGTLHLKFRSENHWELLNRQYAKAKGQVLPEKI